MSGVLLYAVSVLFNKENTMANVDSSIVEFDITPGQAVWVSDRIRRITAPNPSLMTGPGTNTYIVGQQELAIIDPGPDIESHMEAIVAACAGAEVRWIMATHTHPDHSPGAAILAERLGAEVVGAVLDNDGHQDTSFAPLKQLQHEQRFSAENYTLTAIYTPGHVANHFCFWLEQEQILFTGDHIMQGTTVVVIPPSGDMADYLASLSKLIPLGLSRLAPAHGHIMTNAEAVVQGIIDHRMKRERKVVESMGQLGKCSLDTLAAKAYDDVAPELLSIAKIALWAHLLKLEKDGRAEKHAEQHWLMGDELWQLI